MKKTLILTGILLFTVSCGYVDTMARNCGLNPQLCETLFGNETEQNDKLNELETRVSANEKEILSLKTMVDSLISDLSVVSSQASNNAATLVLLETTINNNQGDVNALTVQYNNLLADTQSLLDKVTYQEVIINGMLADITALQSSDSIVEYIDPCGDKTGYYDEVILKTSSGKLVAYFEDGGKRFLTVLTSGSYRTTDKQACHFDVDSSGNIVNQRL